MSARYTYAITPFTTSFADTDIHAQAQKVLDIAAAQLAADRADDVSDTGELVQIYLVDGAQGTEFARLQILLHSYEVLRDLARWLEAGATYWARSCRLRIPLIDDWLKRAHSVPVMRDEGRRTKDEGRWTRIVLRPSSFVCWLCCYETARFCGGWASCSMSSARMAGSASWKIAPWPGALSTVSVPP
jgi:hypothetical protein